MPKVTKLGRSETEPNSKCSEAQPTVLLNLTFQSHLTTPDRGLECLCLVPVWTISEVQGGQ